MSMTATILDILFRCVLRSRIAAHCDLTVKVASLQCDWLISFLIFLLTYLHTRKPGCR